MESDKSVLRAFDPLATSGKENTSFNPAFATPTAKSSGPGRTNALTLSGFFNRYAHPRPRLQQSKLHGDLLVDVGDGEEKKRSVLASSLLGGDFAGGIRRESFPGKHAHVPDISFNIERVNEEGFVNDGTHPNDLPHEDHPEAMPFDFENDQTPVPTTMHNLSTPAPRESNPELEQDVDMAYTIRMIPAPISPTRTQRKEFPLVSPSRMSTIDSSPVTAFKARTAPTWDPLPMRSASPTRIPSPTRVPSPVRPLSQGPFIAKPETLANNVQSAIFPKLKLDLGQGFEFALSEGDRVVQPTPTRSAPARPNDPQTLAGRAAAMRFVSAEQTLIEADSIMDVQLPDVVEDEATTGFLWSKGGIHKPESMGTLSRKVSVSSRKREEPVFKPEAREPAPTHKRQESAPVVEITPSVSPPPRVRCNSAASNLAANTSTSTLPEDEPTLNISALGLSALGNTLLVDTSLEQLTARVGALGLGDGTFGGASFAAEYPSEDEAPKRQHLDVKTPKVTRTMSNPLPERESSDFGVDVEATVKKPQPVKGRVVSDAVVDDLRSGRALHRVTSSVSSVSSLVGSQVHLRSLSKDLGALALGESARQGPHQRADSMASPRTGSPMPHPRADSALQRTESATSSHHSGSSVSHRQTESVRSHSRASSVAERDAEDETPRTRPSSTLSRPSSRLSSVYAASESSLRHPTHTGRPGSAASFNDRPSSVASIRPPSVASSRATSTRPESAASERPPSATSATATPASTHRRMLSGMSVHPMCTASENLQHLARGMEEDVRKEMQAFMLDDMEEYMRSEDDTCMPQPRAAPLTKTRSVPTAPSGIREPGTAPRVRPRASMLPPPVPAAKAGSKVPSTPRPASGIIAPKAGSGSIAPKTVSAKSSSSTLGTRSSGTTLGTRSSTLGPSSRTKTPASGGSKIAPPSASARSSASTTGSLRSRSATGPAPAVAPPLSVRGTRPPVAPSGKPKTLRPRSSSSGLAAPKAVPEEEPRRSRPAASTISGRGATGSRIGTTVGGGSLSRPTSSSQMTAGSVASLRRR
ncbi:hypothetical protein FRC10_008850 [Ceratobasidium sp. 414]|nr:hypothetical protein FRC10_008850 [Ceratobasidium sp. 414]